MYLTPDIERVVLKLTFMGLHVHSVVLKAVNPADKSDRLPDEVHDLRLTNEWMRLAMHCLNFLCHL